jgi:1-acyl-sn-glycerol-3-phosphate acyltransferase
MNQWQYQPAQDQDLAPAQKLMSVRREPGLPALLCNQAWGIVSSTALRLLLRLSISGREHLPRKGPFVLAANHCSHLDALCLAAALPMRLRHEAFPVAAGDTFFDTPAHAAMAALLLNAVPMWRRKVGRHALDDLRDKLLSTRCILLIFPEGTRSRDGAMRPFKSGLGMLVAGTEVPVVPCYLAGTFEALPPGARSPRLLPLRLRVGRPLDFSAIANDRGGWEQVSRSVESAVRSLGREGAGPGHA